MSRNRTYISKNYINKVEVLKSIEEIALNLGFRIEKENTYSSLSQIDIIIDPINDEDDLVYRSSIWISSEKDFKIDKIIYNKEKYYIYIYTNELDSNDGIKYFNRFIREFLQVYPSILVDSGGGENFVSIEEILNQSESIPSWMLIY